MRNNYRVYDADTHISPSAETLEEFLSSRVRELVPDLDSYKSPIKIGLAGVRLTGLIRLGWRPRLARWGARLKRSIQPARLACRPGLYARRQRLPPTPGGSTMNVGDIMHREVISVTPHGSKLIAAG